MTTSVVTPGALLPGMWAGGMVAISRGILAPSIVVVAPPGAPNLIASGAASAGNFAPVSSV